MVELTNKLLDIIFIFSVVRAASSRNSISLLKTAHLGPRPQVGQIELFTIVLAYKYIHSSNYQNVKLSNMEKRYKHIFVLHYSEL